MQKPTVVRSLSDFKSYFKEGKFFQKCVSFDIFDTMVERCIELQIHLQVAKIIEKFKIKTPSELLRIKKFL